MGIHTTGTGCQLTSECPAEMWLCLPLVRTQSFALNEIQQSSSSNVAALTSATNSLHALPNSVMLHFLTCWTH